MKIDLEQKSKELKEFVSQFETSKFLGEISTLMLYIRTERPIENLKGLSSPQRQLLYLSALNLSSSPSKVTKDKFSKDDFEYMKLLLNEIEEGYQQLFYPKNKNSTEEEWKSITKHISKDRQLLNIHLEL